MNELNQLKQLDPARMIELEEVSDEAFDSIATGVLSTPRDRSPARTQRGLRARSLPRLALAAGIACAIAIAVVLTGQLTRRDSGINPFSTPETSKAWSAELVQFAESSPLVLLDPSKWEVRAIDQQQGSGSITFRRKAEGPMPLVVDLAWDDYSTVEKEEAWQLSNQYPGLIAEDVPIMDTEAMIFNQSGTYNASDLPFENPVPMLSIFGHEELVMQITGNATEVEDFEEVMSDVESVGIDTWLQAMPPSVIRAGQEYQSTIRKMLRGIPLPPGFSTDEIVGSNLSQDWYYVGANVTGSIACQWLASWASARKDGDLSSEIAAEKALSTSREWPILRRMWKQGAWPQAVNLVADEMKIADRSMKKYGRPFLLAAPSTLGCGQLGVKINQDDD